MPEIENANDFALVSENSSKLLLFFNRLNDNMGMLGMGFATSKCEMLLQCWIGSKPNLIEGEEVGEVDGFCYLSSCISRGGRISDELLSCA